jgi:hypothetical protein
VLLQVFVHHRPLDHHQQDPLLHLLQNQQLRNPFNNHHNRKLLLPFNDHHHQYSILLLLLITIIKEDRIMKLYDYNKK